MSFGHSPPQPLDKAHDNIPHDAMGPSFLHLGYNCLSVNPARLTPATLNEVITFMTKMPNKTFLVMIR